jgi:uncharacterized membrane protein
MFIGHYALAFGAKRYAPQVSLGILFLACQLADLIWPNLVLLGIEVLEIEPGITALTPLNFLYYPYSHSLIALVLWSTAFAVIYALLRRSGTKAAIVIALLVISHWVLDVIAHRPDMPVTLGDSSLIGFGLWNVPVVAVALELVLFAAGICLYVRQTKPVNRQGSIGFWSLT